MTVVLRSPINYRVYNSEETILFVLQFHEARGYTGKNRRCERKNRRCDRNLKAKQLLDNIHK